MRRKSTTKALKERYSRREILPIIHADEINGICPNIENIEQAKEIKQVTPRKRKAPERRRTISTKVLTAAATGLDRNTFVI